QASVTLHPMWDEASCDLAWLEERHRAFQESIGRARATVRRLGPATEPQGRLAATAARFYAPLQALYEVFENRLQQTHAARFVGRVVAVVRPGSDGKDLSGIDPVELADVLSYWDELDMVTVVALAESTGQVDDDAQLRYLVTGTGAEGPCWLMSWRGDRMYL